MTCAKELAAANIELKKQHLSSWQELEEERCRT